MPDTLTIVVPDAMLRAALATELVDLGHRLEAAVGADIVAFSYSAGLFAGASIEGSYLDADNDWNALYYGPGANTKAIVLDRRYTSPGAEPIRQYLAKW
jgi:lipid-binding SYLF domain-containing protein